MYIPSVKKTGERINEGVRDFVSLDVASVLTGMHGGCTMHNVHGMDKKTSLHEQIQILDSRSNKRIDRKEITRLACYVREQLEQDEVAFEIDNVMEII
jgi:hypothetical protein